MTTKKEINTQIKKAMKEMLKIMGTTEFNKIFTKTQFPTKNIPLNAWSFTNQFNCYFDHALDKKISIFEAFEKELDYRGKQQWKKAGRKVTKNNFSFIYVPIKKRYYQKNNEKAEKTYLSTKEYETLSDETKEMYDLQQYSSFKAIPVYELEYTKGKPIQYPKIELPNYNYEQVAKFLGITIKAEHGGKNYYGAYNPNQKLIKLATADKGTFYHELAHAVDGYLLEQKGKKLTSGQDIDQEAVAQATSGILAYINGEEIEQNIGYTKQYINKYTGNKAVKKIMQLSSRIEAVVSFILNFKENKSAQRKVEEKQGEPRDTTEKIADNPPKAKGSD